VALHHHERIDPASRRLTPSPPRVSRYPLTDESGVRNSCDMFATNSRRTDSNSLSLADIMQNEEQSVEVPLLADPEGPPPSRPCGTGRC
jgi:hypothetical protein